MAGSGAPAFTDGSGTGASFNRPTGADVSTDGTTLYVADSLNHRIRAITISTGAVSTLAGTGSAGYSDGRNDCSNWCWFSSDNDCESTDRI